MTNEESKERRQKFAELCAILDISEEDCAQFTPHDKELALNCAPWALRDALNAQTDRIKNPDPADVLQVILRDAFKFKVDDLEAAYAMDPRPERCIIPQVTSIHEAAVRLNACKDAAYYDLHAVLNTYRNFRDKETCHEAMSAFCDYEAVVSMMLLSEEATIPLLTETLLRRKRAYAHKICDAFYVVCDTEDMPENFFQA